MLYICIYYKYIYKILLTFYIKLFSKFCEIIIELYIAYLNILKIFYIRVPGTYNGV